MTVAEQIKHFHINLNNADYNGMVAECEQKAQDIDQDWDNESTTYEFVDGSVLVWSGNEISCYGSKN